MLDLLATTVVDSVLSLKDHFMGHSTKCVPHVFNRMTCLPKQVFFFFLCGHKHKWAAFI